MGNQYDQKLREGNRKTLEQIQQYTDQTLYSNSMELLNDSFLGGYPASRLDDFFLYGTRLSESALLEDFQQIINLCIQNSFVEHITLYQKEDDILLDNIVGLCYNVSGSMEILDKSLPLSTYLEKTGSSPDRLFYMTEKNLPEGKRNSLTLMRSIPFYMDHSEGKGFIAIHFNEKEFLRTLDERFPLGGGLFILSPEKAPLFYNTSAGPDFETLMEITDWPVIEENHYYHDFFYDNTRYCLTWVKSAESGWTYLSYIPIDILKAEANMTRQFILMLVLLVILFSMIAVQRISSKIYRPINLLRAKFETKQPVSSFQDDLSAIEDAFCFLESQMDDMKNTLDLNSDVLLYKTLIELLYNKDLFYSSIQKRLELCGICFSEPDFCLMVMDFDNTVFYSLDIEQREYLSGKAKELISNWFQSDIVKIVESHPDSQVITFLNLNSPLYDNLCSTAKQLNSFLQKELHIKVNLAVSSLISCPEEVYRIYSEALTSLKYFFIYNYGNTFTPEPVAALEKGSFSLSEKDRKQIEELLRSDKINELMALLTGYLEIIHNGNCSYQDANTFLMQIYGIAFRQCRKLGLFEDTSRKNQIIEAFNQATTLDASMECIYLLLQLHHEALNEESRNADAKLIGQVTDYIHKHCQEELTLPIVAEAFHISPSHLSRLFKSVRGENFSVYVIDQKLSYGAGLLLEYPDKSIAEIAEETGYYTPAYFTRLFKEKFGVTPSQYRKEDS
jgi:YesN/AraC family two-component response regulator